GDSFRHYDYGLLNEFAGPIVRGEQRFHFLADTGIVADLSQPTRPGFRRPQESRIEQFLDPFPVLGAHPHAGASPVRRRNSHARATAQSRFTVAGLTPNDSAVSSIETPAKKRSSTIRDCCGSTCSRSTRASSNATRSRFCSVPATRSSASVRVTAPAPRFAV